MTELTIANHGIATSVENPPPSPQSFHKTFTLDQTRHTLHNNKNKNGEIKHTLDLAFAGCDGNEDEINISLPNNGPEDVMERFFASWPLSPDFEGPEFRLEFSVSDVKEHDD